MIAANVLVFCRITIALAFALAVIGKAQDISAFQEAILDFQLLPPNWSKSLAWILLGAETFVVLLVVIGKSMLLLGFLLAILLLIAFAIVLVLVLRSNKRLALQEKTTIMSMIEFVKNGDSII